MAYESRTVRGLAHCGFAALLGLALVTGAAGLAGRAHAQTAGSGSDATAADATKKKDDKKKNDKVSSWVKLCQEMEIKKGDPKKSVCIVHHERLDPNSGMTIVAAAVRTIEGVDKQAFMVTVPLGVALPPGMQIKVDDQKDPIALKYSHCLPNGCTAETEATKELLQKLMSGKVVNVATINAGAPEQILFQVPLNGFKQTYDGPPVDPAKFENARKQLLLSIREKMIERAKAAQAAKGGGTGTLDAPAGGDQTGTTGQGQAAPQ